MSRASAWGERPKNHYWIRNWREYDRGLIARGDLTVWISPDLAWYAAEGTRWAAAALTESSFWIAAQLPARPTAPFVKLALVDRPKR